jgi:hypothetical protein
MIWSDLIGNYKQHFECGERLTNSLEHFLERLPGAIQAAARAAQAMGLSVNGTTAELFKLMEDGKLVSEDFLPYFSEELMKAAKNGGALEQSMKSTAASIGRFQTAVWKANRTFNQSGFDKTVGALFDTLSFSINQANPVWQLFGKISEIVGRALRAPIELLGTLSAMLDGVLIDKMGNFTDKAKALAAALLLVSRKARIIAIAFWLIPAAISAINDTLQNGMGGWDDWVTKLGIAAAAIAVLAKPLRNLVKLLRDITRLSRSAGGALTESFGGGKGKTGGGWKSKIGKAITRGKNPLIAAGILGTGALSDYAANSSEVWSDPEKSQKALAERLGNTPNVLPNQMPWQNMPQNVTYNVNTTVNESNNTELTQQAIMSAIQTAAGSNPVTEQ